MSAEGTSRSEGADGGWAARGGRVAGDLVRWCLAAVVDLAGLVWPRRCAGCAVPDVALCPGCFLTLSGPPRLGVLPGTGLPLWAAAGYDGVPVTVLLGWKERDRYDLTAPLGRALAGPLAAAVTAVAAAGWGPPVLVPVPTSARARRRRGADLVADLTRRAAREHGAGVPVPRALRLTRRVRDQAGLGAAARSANLAGAMAVRRGAARRWRGRPVLLVDDVVTTGATMREASRALASHRLHVVGALCLCVTSRHPPGTTSSCGRASLLAGGQGPSSLCSADAGTSGAIRTQGPVNATGAEGGGQSP
jgi:predicted amidophosphoribosyltransferase